MVLCGAVFIGAGEFVIVNTKEAVHEGLRREEDEIEVEGTDDVSFHGDYF